MKKLAILILIISFAMPVFTFGQIGVWSDYQGISEMAGKIMQVKQEQLLNVKTWQLPKHMLDNLKYMKVEFDRAFQAQLEYFISEVRNHYEEFKDMPTDVILADFNLGILVTREGYQKILEQAKKKK